MLLLFPTAYRIHGGEHGGIGARVFWGDIVQNTWWRTWGGLEQGYFGVPLPYIVAFCNSPGRICSGGLSR